MNIKTNLLEDYVNFVDITKKRKKSYGYVQLYLYLYQIFSELYEYSDI